MNIAKEVAKPQDDVSRRKVVCVGDYAGNSFREMWLIDSLFTIRRMMLHPRYLEDLHQSAYKGRSVK